MSDRRALLERLAPVALVLVLGALTVLPAIPGLRLASAEPDTARALDSVFDALAEDAPVLVGFDPDVGTYPEIRATTRAVLADLLSRDATLLFVSLTAEGRVLALAELARLQRLESNPRQIIDLGYVPGAEAALVSLARTIAPGTLEEGLLGTLAGAESVERPALAVVVGGNDLGPRAWVEQVRPRLDGLALVAVAPTVLLPELQPYLLSGQLEGLLGTPRDGAAYRAAIDPGRLGRITEPVEPSAAALLAGVLVAIAVLGQGLATRAGGLWSGNRGRDAW